MQPAAYGHLNDAYGAGAASFPCAALYEDN